MNLLLIKELRKKIDQQLLYINPWLQNYFSYNIDWQQT